jgi:hypothetical protein
VSCLDATFTLTPLSPAYFDPLNSKNSAFIECHGADFDVYTPFNLSSLYGSNRFFFDAAFASDPSVDYTQLANRSKARYLISHIDLTGYAGAYKQLALIFGFDVLSQNFPARVLVYSYAGLLQVQQLVLNDNQFLLEIESLDAPLDLLFIHAGGYWFFKGLSGYVV